MHEERLEIALEQARQVERRRRAPGGPTVRLDAANVRDRLPRPLLDVRDDPRELGERRLSVRLGRGVVERDGLALRHQLARHLERVDRGAEGGVHLVGDARGEATEGRHLLGRHELLLARLQGPVGGFELRERRGELLRPLVHAALEVAVQQPQVVERAGVLQRERRLVGERAEKRGVARGERRARALPSADDEAAQHALAGERDDQLGPERVERRESGRAVGGGLARQRLAYDDLGQRGEKPRQRRILGEANRRPAVGGGLAERFLEEPVGGAEEDGGVLQAQHGHGEAERHLEDGSQLERRSERGAGGREHFLGLVRLAAEAEVDDALHPIAERRQDEEHRQREGEREDGRAAEPGEMEPVRPERRGQEIRQRHEAAQDRIIEAALDERVDREEVALVDRVGDRQREEERRVADDVDGNLAVVERRVAEHRRGRDEPADDAEDDDAHAVADELGGGLHVSRDHAGEQAEPGPGETERRELVHRRIARRIVEPRLVDDGHERERHVAHGDRRPETHPPHGEEQGEMEEHGGQERLGQRVQPEQYVRPVEVHGGERVNADAEADRLERPGGRASGAQRPDADADRREHEPVEEVDAEDQKGVAPREEVRGDAAFEAPSVPLEGVREDRSGAMPAHRLVYVRGTGHGNAVHGDDRRLEDLGERRHRPTGQADRGDDAVAQEEETRERPAHPADASARRYDGEAHHRKQQQRAREPGPPDVRRAHGVRPRPRPPRLLRASRRPARAR